jgi:hypothetical protein
MTSSHRPEVMAAAREMAARVSGRGALPTEAEQFARALADALVEQGWRPPSASAGQRAGGKASGQARIVGKVVRRALVDGIVQNLPASYRNHPRSAATLNRVADELRKLAASPYLSERMKAWATGSHATLKTDIDALGFRAKQRITRLSK